MYGKLEPRLQQTKTRVLAHPIETFIVAGFAGFFLGCLLLFFGDLFSSGKKTVFHEVEYNPRSIVSQMISKYSDSLLNTHKSTDSAEAIKLRNKFETLNAGTDSSFIKRINNTLVAHLTPEELNTFHESPVKDAHETSPLHWIFRDTAFLQQSAIEDNVPLKVVSFPSDVDFFTKYPGFAIWVLFIVSYMATLMIVLAIGYFTRQNQPHQLQEFSNEKLRRKRFRKRLLLVGILMALFAFIIFKVFYDGSIAKDVYLLPWLRVRILLLGVVAYSVTALCFAGFIDVAASLDWLNARYRDCLLRDGVDGLKAEKEKITDTYRILQGNFNNYFYCTAVVLSFLIFCTGALYTAINSMDILKKLHHDLGYSPVRYDFVYVYGGIHTILILLFYIPVRLRFTSFRNDFAELLPAETAAAGTDQGVMGKIAAPVKKVTGLLVAASPILATLVQSLFELIFGS